MSFFRGLKNTISNIAQVLLVVILLPGVSLILGAVGGKSSQTGFVNSLFGKIPLCDIWLDILYQHKGGLSAESVLSSAAVVILKAFPEAIISAICVYVCIQISKKLNARGLPIFATFVGIVIASVLTTLTGITGNVNTEIIADFGVLLVMVIGLRIMMKSVFRGMKVFSLKKVLLFIIDGLFAVITTAYISGLLIAASGYYSSAGEIIGQILILTGIEIFVAFGVGIIGDLADKDQDVF